MHTKIDPKQLMKELTVAELCQTAEEFYRHQPEPTVQRAQPFASILEAPQLLYRLGLLLSGLRLGKSMVVLDFGAGACWFSRLLNQMQCITISVDVSETALELGKRLFDESPIVGEYLRPPRFLVFDGERMDVADESVDRIICFDVFHHVPNQEQILREFYRILKPGGIAGFSEPGLRHSQSAVAQYAMRTYRVLENDINLYEIWKMATAIGFGDLRVKLVTNLAEDLNCDDYARIAGWNTEPSQGHHTSFLATMRRLLGRNILNRSSNLGGMQAPPFEILRNVVPAMRDTTIFFLDKGMHMPDSRTHVGLRHELELLTKKAVGIVGEPMELEVRLKNVGQAKWLHRNIQGIGVVKVGVHLLDTDRRLLEYDFARAELDEDVLPGQVVTVKFPVLFADRGEYVLSLDLVAESVEWFELLGSQPRYLRVRVA